jgi:YVTN family beta-propeller protein
MLLLAGSAAAQTVIDTFFIGTGPVATAVNPNNNKIYVANQWDNTVGIINGADDSFTTVSTGSEPYAFVVDTITNKVYTGNFGDDVVTVIDGNNNTSSILVGNEPTALAFDSARNRIYVANTAGETVSVIDGRSNLVIATIPVRQSPQAIAVNPVTGKVYVANSGENTVSIIDGNNLSLAPTTLLTGQKPISVAVNSLTNKIYVVNELNNPGTVTVIDGVTNHTTNVTVGDQPWMLAINPVTNKIYVAVHYDAAVMVIDGATNNTTLVNLPDYPTALAVDRVTNKIYVITDDSQGLSVIDGLTLQVHSIAVGNEPDALVVTETSNRVYTANYADNTISVIAGVKGTPLQFLALTPCRLVDTRPQYGGGGPILAGASQAFNLPQLAQAKGCANLSSAAAYSLNVAVIPPARLSYLTIWPTGQDQPLVATLNSIDGRIKANAAITAGGYQGDVSVYATDTTNVVIDIDGYFAPVTASTLAFYPLTPCRIADTRKTTFPPGLGTPHLAGNAEREFPLLSSQCNIPPSAKAYSLNLAAVPYPSMGHALGYLEVWPTGQRPQNPVSTLNNLTGTVVANAAIVPAGTTGQITVFPSNDTDLVMDINGYFAPAGLGGLSLYPSVPCRVIDTRHVGSGQPFNGFLTPSVDVAGSVCEPDSSAKSYVFNATVVPFGSVGYLTLWPDGTNQPLVSTLNALDGFITNNMAIVPSTDGRVDAFASGFTQLILDISSYFAQ